MTAPNYFVPQQMPIMGITRGNPTTVITFGDHNYTSGLVVRIDVPLPPAPPRPGGSPPPVVQTPRGMPQINGMIGEITVTGTDEFTIPINSTGFDRYVTCVAPNDFSYVGQVIPVGENAFTLSSAGVNNNNITPEIYGTPPAPQTI